MSNPLALFRKYQKILLVVFGVALMIVFTIGSLVMQFLGGQSDSARDKPVVAYVDGEIGENEMSVLRYRRTVLARFMQTITFETFRRQGQVPMHLLQASLIPPRNDEQSILQTHLLSDQAKKMGMAVKKEEIFEFLKTYSDNQITAEEFENELRSLTSGRMSMHQFLDAFANHLLAYRYYTLMAQGLQQSGPLAQWDSFQRLNRRIEIEAVKYPVADYLSQVPEPDDEDVVRIYDEGKNEYPSPNSPKPGFKELKQVAFEYIRADMTPFLEAEKAKITDEEVQKYYDENKEEFRKLDLPTEDDIKAFEADSSDAAEAESTAEESDVNPDSAEAESDSNTDPGIDDAEESPAEKPELKKEVDSESATKDTEQESNSTAGDEDASESATAADDGTQSKDDDSAPTDGCGPQEDDEATDGEADTDETEPAENNDDTVPPDDTSTGTADQDPVAIPDEKTNAVEDKKNEDDSSSKPDEAPTTDGKESTGVDDAEVTDTESKDRPSVPASDADLDAVPSEPKKPEYTPVDEVAEQIRQKLARQRISQPFETKIGEAAGKMREYFGTYVSWSATAEEDRGEQPPSPDLDAIAKDLGFTNGSFPLIDVLELADRDDKGEPKYKISSAFQPLADGRQLSLIQAVFDDELRAYESLQFEGEDLETKYLVWKTDETPRRVPTLDECRDRVIEHIKSRRAAKLVADKIKAEADRISQSGKSLVETFGADVDVIQPNKFSWMTLGLLGQGSPTLGEVTGIKDAGNNFMKSVFRLKSGQVGLAMDDPEKNGYLIFVKSEETIPGKESFVRIGVTNDVRRVNTVAFQLRLNEWYESYLDAKKIDWLRDPISSTLRLR